MPDEPENQANLICQAAWDLLTVVRSFCEASTADLQIKIGISTGRATTGIIGQNKCKNLFVSIKLNFIFRAL